MSENFQQRLFDELQAFFEPVVDAASDARATFGLLEDLGWDIEALLGPASAAFLTKVQEAAQGVDVIRQVVENPPETIAELIDTLEAILATAEAIRTLPGTVPNAPPEMAAVIKQLLSRLAARYVAIRAPLGFAVARLLGIARVETMPPVSQNNAVVRSPGDVVSIRFQQVGDLLTDPLGTLREEYFPNGLQTESDAAIASAALFPRLAHLLQALGGEPTLGRDQPVTGTTAAELARLQRMLTWSHRFGDPGGVSGEVGATLELVPATNGGPGLLVAPFGSVELERTVGNWQIRLTVSPGIRGFLVTPTSVTIRSGGGLPGVRASLILAKGNQQPALLIGSTTDTRLEIGTFRILADALIEESKQEYGVSLEVGSGAIVIKTGEGDGFLQKVLPPDGLATTFDFLVGWSSANGFYFRGSAALEVTLPIHATLGPVTIESIYLLIKAKESGDIDLVLAATAGLEIGPISASVDRIGLRTNLSFPDDGGNLGPVELAPPSFKPPTGAGLAIDAGGVTGGGYVEFDNENQRYAGILQLKLAKIGLLAIGLIDTRMPDGSKGFALLVMIAVEFDPPIALPYNFKLRAVGGLLGLNRTMMVEVIRSGLKNHTIDSILFPENPIQNAPRIISDLRAVFPPAEGRFVVAPMATLDWNSPPVFTAELGIMIELPSPVRIAIVGQFSAAFPKPDDAVVELHLDVLGELNFEKQTFALDATLYDSRILAYTLKGDSAMRLYWGDPPNFAFSVGGINPKSKVPALPKLDRLQLSLGSGNNPRISLDCYFAVTSNSVQTGARLEVLAKKAGFTISGYLGFDALFIFSPFSFTIDMGAGVAVKKGSKRLMSVRLDFTLSGPTPWRAKGKATFEVLWVDVKVRFDKKWGRERDATLPSVDPEPLLREALGNPDSWAGVLPPRAATGVSLRSATGANQPVVVLPTGTLEVRQRVLPLGLTIRRFGNAPVGSPRSFAIDQIVVTDTPFALGPVKDYFARGKFETLSDKDKLSKPSFEKLTAGHAVGAGRIAFDAPQTFELEYETEYMDDERAVHALPPTKLPRRYGLRFLAAGAAGLGGLRVTGSGKYLTPAAQPAVTMAEPGYAVVNATTLAAAPVMGGATSLTQAEAEDRMGSTAGLAVVPIHEVVP